MQKKCAYPDHERVSFCYDCKIKECNHCIIYHCSAGAFEDNLKEFCQNLIKNENENNFIGLYYTLNQFFTLLTCYWGFGQPDKENYGAFFDHLNFTLPGVSCCNVGGNVIREILLMLLLLFKQSFSLSFW